LIPFNREFGIVVVMTLFNPIFIYASSEFFLTPDSWSLVLYPNRDVSINVASNAFDDALSFISSKNVSSIPSSFFYTFISSVAAKFSSLISGDLFDYSLV